jgi:ATP-dependent DNA ligase
VPLVLLSSGRVSEGAGRTVEVKWDGCRAQLRYDRCSISLRTRNDRECSGEFSELAAIGEVLGRHRVTVDGELGVPARRRATGFRPASRASRWQRSKPGNR